jgi:hypothetical protein
MEEVGRRLLKRRPQIRSRATAPKTAAINPVLSSA